jgi:hypothetical protein
MHRKYISLLLLRLYQSWRMLRSVGWGLLAVFLVISIGISFPLVNNILKASYRLSIPGTMVVIILLDLYRKDKSFLKAVFHDKNTLTAYLGIEYTIIAMPVWLYQMFDHFFIGIIIIILCFMVAWLSGYIRPPERTTQKKSLHFIPLSYFELKFFIERNPYGWLLFWLMGVSAVVHIGLYIFWMIILLMSIPELFRYYESRDMLHWKRGFVFEKIKKYSIIFFMIALVPSITAVGFHPEMYMVVIYLNLCLISALVLNIAMKYAGYTPVFHAASISNITGMLTLIMLFPGGVIITIGYSIWKYMGAEKNLKTLYA